MTPIDIRPTDFLDPVPNPTHFYVDFACVVAKAIEVIHVVRNGNEFFGRIASHL
jgi:hypothetical protein